MKARTIITLLIGFGFCFASSAQLATQDMGNQQMGGGSLFSVDSMPAQPQANQQDKIKSKRDRRRELASQQQQQQQAQPQISEAQMQEMMKVLQDYQKQTQERNKALEQLMQEP